MMPFAEVVGCWDGAGWEGGGQGKGSRRGPEQTGCHCRNAWHPALGGECGVTAGGGKNAEMVSMTLFPIGVPIGGQCSQYWSLQK